MTRGFTLVEVLVSLVLLAGMTWLVVMFLIPTLRITARGSTQVTLQQQGVLALTRMAADLQKTTPQGLSRSPTAMGIVTIADVSGQRALVWEQSMRVYFWDPATRRLARRTWPPDATTEPVLAFSSSLPPVATEEQLAAICALPPDIILAAGVRQFEIDYPGRPGPFQQPLTLSLVLEQKAVSGQQVETFSCRRTVYLRNHGNPQ
jgi:prepilin-type N-terminal cleavage/methylation domain-containing protein